MNITMHRCQCHELSCGLCAACELSLRDELRELFLFNEEHDAARSEFEQLNPPSGSEVWPR